MATNPRPPLKKRVGWAGVVAGVVLIVLGAGSGIAIDVLLAPKIAAHTDPGLGPFVGKLDVGLVLIAVCGVLGIFNGLGIVRTGRPNAALTLLIVVIFLAAFGIMYNANDGYHPASDL